MDQKQKYHLVLKSKVKTVKLKSEIIDSIYNSIHTSAYSALIGLWHEFVCEVKNLGAL